MNGLTVINSLPFCFILFSLFYSFLKFKIFLLKELMSIGNEERRNKGEKNLNRNTKYKHIIFKWLKYLIENSNRDILCGHRNLMIKFTDFMAIVMMAIFKPKKAHFNPQNVVSSFWISYLFIYFPFFRFFLELYIFFLLLLCE
jgi:hypothetical protein